MAAFPGPLGHFPGDSGRGCREAEWGDIDEDRSEGRPRPEEADLGGGAVGGGREEEEEEEEEGREGGGVGEGELASSYLK